MFAQQLHQALAAASVLALLAAVVLAALCLRASATSTHGMFERAMPLALLLAIAAASVGAAVFLTGARPRGAIHYLYAGLALAALVFAITVGARGSLRRRAATTAGLALLAVVLVVRLYATG